MVLKKTEIYIKLNNVKQPGTEAYSGKIIIFQVQGTNLETRYQVKHWTKSNFLK
jgi:hypothetical protein